MLTVGTVVLVNGKPYLIETRKRPLCWYDTAVELKGVEKRAKTDDNYTRYLIDDENNELNPMHHCAYCTKRYIHHPSLFRHLRLAHKIFNGKHTAKEPLVPLPRKDDYEDGEEVPRIEILKFKNERKTKVKKEEESQNKKGNKNIKNDDKENLGISKNSRAISKNNRADNNNRAPKINRITVLEPRAPKINQTHMVNQAQAMIQNAPQMLQNGSGIIQNGSGMIQNGSGIIQNAPGMIQNAPTMVQTPINYAPPMVYQNMINQALNQAQLAQQQQPVMNMPLWSKLAPQFPFNQGGFAPVQPPLFNRAYNDPVRMYSNPELEIVPIDESTALKNKRPGSLSPPGENETRDYKVPLPHDVMSSLRWLNAKTSLTVTMIRV